MRVYGVVGIGKGVSYLGFSGYLFLLDTYVLIKEIISGLRGRNGVCRKGSLTTFKWFILGWCSFVKLFRSEKGLATEGV